MKAVADAGHEIGIHGYSHENPIAMTREQETEILDKCIDLVSQLSASGRPATWRRGGSSRRSPTSCCSSAASSTTIR
jgi:peptidoglycan/xylan/chitin deacetylase (PgdA/CDA1 family)